ncbi:MULTISPECIES: IclR family transcriptional regulator [unclassified Chelatococcus]|uniref:IclR family transcriptional regulator n=1 Tax=unclassified Chelatococcus TaxID=2638111 RepID=UPI001BCEBDC9|nr:IclR family transcriptional regulator [Chelatococcus sp.]MBS7742552.1 IclR family transcriptional regulator [Chelatococcus sp. HY11]CAH1655810.1 Transcriptional regulator, IclR family [Hyphomicrobiales bacterium]MBX3542330.1 IclR family transcriptional regulator [Chelatococcus sp.]MCO5075452.1 IclR family transcriptional regulator [Chelatococcus sp.]CAH1695643.1 Transcriptional regulator, IclR family [Hyphomicrobiales bacterium]
MEKAKSAAGSQSLQRGLEILEILDKSTTPLGVREIGRQLGLNATIVQRLINTLAQYSYVMQDGETRRYSIGYRAFGLGWSLIKKDRLISVVKPELDQLASQHLLNGYLGVLRGSRAVYILSTQSEGPIVIRSVPGSETYLHSTALGKVLLAGLPEEEAFRLLTQEPLVQVTPRTKTDVAELMEELKDVRSRGYAMVHSENIQGVISVGAPIRDATDTTVAALSTAFAEWSAPDFDLAQIIALVKETTRRISRSIGNHREMP